MNPGTDALASFARDCAALRPGEALQRTLSCPRWWHRDGGSDTLHAIVAAPPDAAVGLLVLLDDAALPPLQQSTPQTLPALAAARGRALIDTRAPLRLQPVTVRKPWGAEHWYTGMETRGLSQAVTASGQTPLAWLTTLLPQGLLGQLDPRPPLVKRLQAQPAPLHGELYFEIHRRKHEVYVLLDCDDQAWPGRRAALRLGLRPGILQDPGRRAELLAACARYEVLCQARADTAAADATLRGARDALDAFVSHTELAIGDTVTVPPGLPHGLLHGVEVAEFQTPVYERQIIYASQPVTAQQRWNTVAALDGATEIAADTAALKPAAANAAKGDPLQQLASCDGFEVLRATLQPGQDVALPAGAHALVLAERGTTRVVSAAGAVVLTPRQATLLGPAALHGNVLLRSDEPASALLCRPLIHE